MMSAPSNTVNLDDVFKKAAIGVAFDKSSILQNIKHQQYATHDLVKLLNMYNSHSMAEIPIIVIKFVTRLMATTVSNKFTVLRKYIKPENIDISIAPDELNFIINNHRPANSNNIVFIVAKNILTSLFGISAGNLDQQLMKLIESTRDDGDVAANDDRENISSNTTEAVEGLIASSADDYTMPTIKLPSVVNGGFGSVYSSPLNVNSDNDDDNDMKMNSDNVKLIDKFKRLEDYTKRSHGEAFDDDRGHKSDDDDDDVESIVSKRTKIDDYEESPNDNAVRFEISEINDAVQSNEATLDVMSEVVESSDDDALSNKDNNENDSDNSEYSSVDEQKKNYEEIDITDTDDVDKPTIIDDVFVDKKVIIKRNAPSFDDAMTAGNYIDDLINTLNCNKSNETVDYSDCESDC